MTPKLPSMRATLRTLASVAVVTLVATSMVPASEPTSEDPAKLAASYMEQASELRESAEKHAAIARRHSAGGGFSKTAHESVVLHCNRIAENLRAAADESEALAATYRKLADDK